LALVYVRVQGQNGTEAVEAAWTLDGPAPADKRREIAESLEALLGSNRRDQALTAPTVCGSGTLLLFTTPLGDEGNCGVLAAGSQQPDFPSPTDRLLLGVAANQAAIVLQQKRADEQVVRSEQELGDFFESATVGLHWVGPDGAILRANRAELELLGYSADEYIGHHIAEFHADKDVIEEILRRLHAGERIRDCEARMRCKDGSIKHVLIDSSVLWKDGTFSTPAALPVTLRNKSGPRRRCAKVSAASATSSRMSACRCGRRISPRSSRRSRRSAPKVSATSAPTSPSIRSLSSEPSEWSSCWT
jgi:PAS domain S-box-containing protein